LQDPETALSILKLFVSPEKILRFEQQLEKDEVDEDLVSDPWFTTWLMYTNMSTSTLSEQVNNSILHHMQF
jgi:hypothetical protein